MDPGAVSTSAILVANGNLLSRAAPAESDSVVLGALGNNPKGNENDMTRFYFHEQISGKIAKLLESLGLKSA